MIERFVERCLYAGRWLLAPVYLGMSLALLALLIKFFQEIFHILPQILELKESDLVLMLLTLIDLTLVGSLIVMVMFSGYDNFVSQIDLHAETEKLDWLGTHDYGALKLKVAGSIVAISSIHLLKIFMNAEQTANEKMYWYVVIHLTLVVSALLLSILERINKQGENHPT